MTERAPGFRVVKRQERPSMFGQRNKEFLGGRESSPLAKALRDEKRSKLDKFAERHWEEVAGTYGEREESIRRARFDRHVEELLKKIEKEARTKIEKRILANSGDEIRRRREAIDRTEEGWGRQAARRLGDIVGTSRLEDSGSKASIARDVLADARKNFSAIQDIEKEIGELQEQTKKSVVEARLHSRNKKTKTDKEDGAGTALPSDPVAEGRNRLGQLEGQRLRLYRQLGDNKGEQRRTFDALVWEQELNGAFGTDKGRDAIKAYITGVVEQRAEDKLAEAQRIQEVNAQRRGQIRQFTRGEATGGAAIDPTRPGDE